MEQPKNNLKVVVDKKSIVAIGDSFTRGTGSEDNIKYGWVSLIEKK